MSNITVGIISGGQMGTTLANILSENQHDVRLYLHVDDTTLSNIKKTHITCYSDVVLSDSIRFYNDYESVVKNVDVLCLAVPSMAMYSVLIQISQFMNKNQKVINFSKGFHHSSKFMRMSELILNNTVCNKVASISGPSLAYELIKKNPTRLTIGAQNAKDRKLIKNMFSTSYLTFDETGDIAGVEISGVLKNPIAIMVGISEALGYGKNTTAYLISEGIKEIKRIGACLGANPKTFDKSCGCGDVIVTCLGGRNKQFGVYVGQQTKKPTDILNLEMKGILIEGYKTTELMNTIIKNNNINAPIFNSLYNILYKEKDSKQEIIDLLFKFDF